MFENFKTINRLSKGSISTTLLIGAAVIVLTAALINFPIRYTSPGEKSRYAFAVSAEDLVDGSGNKISIHGGGLVGMSGWIIFGGGFNLTLTGTASGIVSVTNANGEKRMTNWEIAKTNYFSFTDWALFIKIKLKEPVEGLPQEFYLDLTEGDQTRTGNIVMSAGLPTLVDDVMTPTEVIASGMGGVSIHGVGRSL